MPEKGRKEMIMDKKEKQGKVENSNIEDLIVKGLKATKYQLFSLHWGNKVGIHNIGHRCIVGAIADAKRVSMLEVCQAICGMIEKGKLSYTKYNLPTQQSMLTPAVLAEHCETWDNNLRRQSPLSQDCKLGIGLPVNKASIKWIEPAAAYASAIGLEYTAQEDFIDTAE